MFGLDALAALPPVGVLRRLGYRLGAGFGLFHGLGFASVMSELPFRMVHLLKVLIGFNVGVELGQLAIVAVVFPVIFAFRKTRSYVPVCLIGGSLLMGGIATYWFIERAFGLS